MGAAAIAVISNKFQVCHKMEIPAFPKFSRSGNPKYSEYSKYSHY
jgi:hypothetical protein